MDPHIRMPPSILAGYGSDGLVHGALPARISIPTTGEHAGTTLAAGSDPFFGQQLTLPSGSAGTKIAVQGPPVALTNLNAVQLLAVCNQGSNDGLVFRMGMFGSVAGACYERIHIGAGYSPAGQFLSGRVAGGATQKEVGFRYHSSSAETAILNFLMVRDPGQGGWWVGIGDDDGSGHRPPSRWRHFTAGQIDEGVCTPQVEWERPNTSGANLVRKVGLFRVNYYRIGG